MPHSRKSRRKKKAITPLIAGQPLTPAQRRAHAETKRRNDAQRRLVCNIFGLWRVCAEKPCQRRKSCSGDMHACFQRWWWLVPEQHKTFYRSYLRAHAEGVSHDDALRRAAAEVEERAAEIAERNAEILARIDATEAHDLT